MIRKQLTFAKVEDVKIIEKAVIKINQESRDGETISVNRFIAQKALDGAVQVLKRKK